MGAHRNSILRYSSKFAVWGYVLKTSLQLLTWLHDHSSLLDLDYITKRNYVEYENVSIGKIDEQMGLLAGCSFTGVFRGGDLQNNYHLFWNDTLFFSDWNPLSQIIHTSPLIPCLLYDEIQTSDTGIYSLLVAYDMSGDSQ